MTSRLGHVNSYDKDARRPNVGTVWVWELDQPHARSLIRVTDVRWNGEEWWVESESLLPTNPPFPPNEAGVKALNDVSRFWEACIPVDDSTMAVMFNSEAGGR